MEWYEIIATVIGAVLGLVVINWAVISKVAKKIGSGAESIASGGDALAETMESFGMVKAPLVIKEGADVADEVGDLATMFANLTADGNLTAEDLKKLFTEGKEGLWVEMKDFRVKVFPKKK